MKGGLQSAEDVASREVPLREYRKDRLSDALEARWLRGFEENDYSKLWAKKRIEDQAQKRIIRGWIRPGESCLELGGGYGRITRVLEPHFRNVVMLDLARRNVRMAKGNLAKASVMRSDISTLPLRDSTFDTVVMIRVVHLLPDPARTMKEILRVIKDGGTLLMSVPNLVTNHLLRRFGTKLFPSLRHVVPAFGPAMWPLGERPFLRPQELFVPGNFRLKAMKGTGLFDNYIGAALNKFPSLSLIDSATSPLWFLKLDVFLRFEAAKPSQV